MKDKVVASERSANDVIRLPGVTFEFVESKPSWWRRPVKSRSAWPGRQLSLTTMDYIGVWYLRNGHQLHSVVYKLGLGPEPLLEEDFDDTMCNDEEWRSLARRLANFPSLVLPPVFGGLVDEWLGSRAGRRVQITIGNNTSACDEVRQIEEILSRAGKATE